MNNKQNTAAATPNASPLTVKEAPKPDLVKKIGNTTFDIHVHFSETSRETFTDKVIRLIQNDHTTAENVEKN